RNELKSLANEFYNKNIINQKVRDRLIKSSEKNRPEKIVRLSGSLEYLKDKTSPNKKIKLKEIKTRAKKYKLRKERKRKIKRVIIGVKRKIHRRIIGGSNSKYI